MKVMKKLLSVVLIAACVLPSGCLFTKKELNQLMKNNKEYSKENLVVFYIEHDSYVLNGEELIDEVQRTDDYWFGWILEDGEFLDMCNMNTGMYYPFEKV